MRKVALEDKTIPCIICEAELDICLFPDSSAKDIETAPIDGGIECRTHGNYGSTVHDLDGVLFFVLCDKCVLKHSCKMIHKAERRKMPGNPLGPAQPGLQNGKDHFDENQRIYEEYYAKKDR